jgi:hypothetical protein
MITRFEGRPAAFEEIAIAKMPVKRTAFLMSGRSWMECYGSKWSFLTLGS